MSGSTSETNGKRHIWRMEEVIRLINNYENLECLWNCKSEKYKRLDLKKKAWLQLSKESGRDVQELKTKIKNLRTSYLSEKKKVDETNKSGALAETVREPQLFYYDHLRFLDSVIVLRRSIYPVDDSVECATESVETDLNDSVYLENESLVEQPTALPAFQLSPCLSAASSSPSLSTSKSRNVKRTWKSSNKFDSVCTSIASSTTNGKRHKWRMEEVIRFINNYEKFECLWNYKSEEYKRLDLKKNAWLQLSKESGRDVQDLKTKIRNLRTSYVSEKKKVDETKKSGASAETVREPQLFYYDHLRFLDSVIVLRRSDYPVPVDDSVECATESVETDLNDCVYLENESLMEQPTALPAFQSSPCLSAALSAPSLPTSKSGNVKRTWRSSNKFDSVCTSIASSPSLSTSKSRNVKRTWRSSNKFDNVCTSFAKSIAPQLQQLTPVEAAETMAEIQQLITNRVVKSIQSRAMPQSYASLSSSAKSSGSGKLYTALVDADNQFDADDF